MKNAVLVRALVRDFILPGISAIAFYKVACFLALTYLAP